jgi:hypothetical protein
MAQAIHDNITSRYHNVPDSSLADLIGEADAVLKGAEAESKALKDD